MRVNQYLPNRSSLKLDYRYYQDDWGVDVARARVAARASTCTHGLSARWEYRWYTQTRADFYRDEYESVGWHRRLPLRGLPAEPALLAPVRRRSRRRPRRARRIEPILRHLALWFTYERVLQQQQLLGRHPRGRADFRCPLTTPGIRSRTERSGTCATYADLLIIEPGAHSAPRRAAECHDVRRRADRADSRASTASTRGRWPASASGSDLFADPCAAVTISAASTSTTVFPLRREPRTFQIVSDPRWNRLVFGETGASSTPSRRQEHGARPLSSRAVCAVDEVNRVYVADAGNDRVLVSSRPAPSSTA